jgi:hypothetical protein
MYILHSPNHQIAHKLKFYFLLDIILALWEFRPNQSVASRRNLIRLPDTDGSRCNMYSLEGGSNTFLTSITSTWE